MSTATKGRHHEHQARDTLRTQGYYVIRAAGSKGLFDLVALPCSLNRHIRLIQVKSNAWPGRRERKELESAATLIGCPHEIEIWRYDDRDTEPKIMVWDPHFGWRRKLQTDPDEAAREIIFAPAKDFA